MNIFENKKDLTGKLLFIISVISLGFMIYLLFTKPFLSIDEWFTKGLVQSRFADIISITAIDVHPPLYYMIVKAVIKALALLNIGFNKIIVVKFVSIIPYFILLAVSVTKIRKEHGWLACGLFAFCVLSMANFFTYYLTARMYSWSLLFVVLSFIYARNIFKDPTIKDWILLSIFSVLGAYTMYFSAVTSICIYLLILVYIIKNKRSEIKNFVISCILNVILYAPWFMVLFSQLSSVHKSYWIKSPTLESTITAFSTVFPSFGIILSCIFTVVLFAVGAYLFKKYYTSKDGEDYYVLTGVMTFIGTVVITAIVSVLFKPVLIPRILVPAAAVFWFSFSILISKLEFNKTVLLVTLIIVVIGAAGVISQVNDISKLNDETIALQEFLSEINNNDSIVIFDSSTKYFRFFEELNNTQQYYVFNINNKTYEKQYVSILDLNKKEFVFPDSILNNTDKNIYFIVDEKTEYDYPDEINATQVNRLNNCLFIKLTG